MLKFKTWVAAARPRTLPLSIAGILVGTGLALREGLFDVSIFVFAILTTLGFQILSNFANDYGDGLKGADNDERLGPKRGLQSGIITYRALKNGIVLTGILTLICAGLLIFFAFGLDELGYGILFLVLALASIGAALKYTMGKSAYGYRGLGDVFVFLFFGLLGVVGSYFLYSKHLLALVWIPAVIIGLLSAAVLNLNNMRDSKGDRNSGKMTLAVKLGETRVKWYHSGLIGGSFFLCLVYIFIEGSPLEWLLVIAFIPLGIHLFRVWKNAVPENLDPELKKVALSTVFFALIYLGTGIFFR